MTGKRKLTMADLDSFLEPPGDDQDLTGYLSAAAVLVAFDPFGLRPFEPSTTAGDPPLDRLLRMCEPRSLGTGRSLWSLLLPHRRSALRRLTQRQELRAALEANPRPTGSATQRMFDQLVGGGPIDLPELSRADIAALFEVHEWATGIIDGLPRLDEIERALDRQDLLAPMRRLAGAEFVGRTAELARCDAYVFGPPSDLPLFVFGTGGVGKSTLLARFILKHVVPRGMPFAYLDIDRPTIRPGQPETLLLEAVSQLAPQVGLPKDAIEPLVKEIASYLRRSETVADGRYYESARFGSEHLFRQYADVFGRTPAPHGVLLVVDTFEEAQFLGPDVVWPLLDFLDDWSTSSPGTRVILSGRTLPDELLQRGRYPRTDENAIPPDMPLPSRPINLGELDMPAARELMRVSMRAADLPPLSDQDIDDVIRIVSPNPMCVKLAVRLLREEGVDKLRDARSVLFTRLKAEKIQALLYGRILRHLHDPAVRAVAYPGLVVRRITAEVVREVLAEPCGLDLTTPGTEYRIVDALSAESALVSIDPEDRSLRHRTDVRRVMLQDLTDQVPADVVERIDRNAVRYYEGKHDAISRAEEIYHRLRLGDSPDVLDGRWLPAAAPRLRNVGDEVSARQWLWLANKLDITLDPAVRATAGQESWESQAARSADRYLQSGRAEDALEVLHERFQRLPRSRLYALEVEAYRLLARPEDALRVARAGVDAAGRAGAIELTLDLLLRMVAIEEGRGDWAAAARVLDEAEVVGANTASTLQRLRVSVTRLRIDRRLDPGADEASGELRQETAATVTPEVIDQLRTEPALLREAAAELADSDPQLAAAAIETLGVEVATDPQTHALGAAITTLHDAEDAGPVDELLADPASWFQRSGYDADVVRTWALQQLNESGLRVLGSALRTSTSHTDDVLLSFRDYFRAGVDASLAAGPEPPA